METLTIQVQSPSAYGFLEDLEKRHILKVVRNPIKPKENPWTKLIGSLSEKDIAELKAHTEQARKEWDRIF